MLKRTIDTSAYLDQEIDPGFARRARIILNNLDIHGDEKVLEVGCGRGFYLRAVCVLFPSAKVTGLDVNDVYLVRARKTIKGFKVKLVKGDGRKLPFPDKSFDRIICTEVLEHIGNDSGTLVEMYRVLKPGGIALFTVPHTKYPLFWDPLNWVLERVFHIHVPSRIWWLAGIWADHIRLYSEKEFTDKVHAAKFHIKRIWRSTHFCLPFSHFLLYGIGKNIVEKGWWGTFNRFHHKKRGTSVPLRFILGVFHLFDSKNEMYEIKPHESYLNIIVKARR